MSAFGRKNGVGGMQPGARPSFGVAKPMKPACRCPGSAGRRRAATSSRRFPANGRRTAAADQRRQPKRQRDGPARRARQRVGRGGQLRGRRLRASVHKIKEQVLPRLLERVDPEAAATLSKDELSEEFRPIIMEVLTELKVTLNRREQFALEKVLIDELLGFGPLEELLNDPDVSDIMVNGPLQTYIEKKGKLQIAPIQFRDESHLFQIAQRSSTRSAAASTRPPRWPTPASRTAAAST
jgi:pilus assembly protein CpaF